jgi:uncharacterized membrane protein
MRIIAFISAGVPLWSAGLVVAVPVIAHATWRVCRELLERIRNRGC